MKVVWSEAALDDFDQLIAYIAERNATAADRVAAVIDRAVGRLGAMQTGRPGRVAGTYEKVVEGLPYIIAYGVTGARDAVVILRVIHGARDWPAGKWPR
jgi:plasmid stabilization system protein ParE